MTGAELRESALDGAGPRFRGRTLRVAWSHYAILQNAGHPVAWTELPEGEMPIDQIVEILFVLAADFEIVYAAANTIGGEGIGFDERTFKFAAAKWESDLEQPLTADEIQEFRRWLPILHGQIAASRFKSIDTSKSASPPDESGN